MNEKIIIKPELENIWWAEKKDVFDNLEKRIIKEGCLDSLKVYKDEDEDGKLVLMDGHNRIKICKKNKKDYKIEVMPDIHNVDEATVWIVDYQRDMRHPTEENDTYASGRRYNATVNIKNRARDEKGVYKADAPRDQFDLMDKPLPNRTAREQAEKEDSNTTTIKRNAVYAKGIDEIKKVNPELAKEILENNKEGPNFTKTEIRNIHKIPKDKVAEVIKAGPNVIKAKSKEIEDKKKEVKKAKKAKEEAEKAKTELEERQKEEAKKAEEDQQIRKEKLDVFEGVDILLANLLVDKDVVLTDENLNWLKTTGTNRNELMIAIRRNLLGDINKTIEAFVIEIQKNEELNKEADALKEQEEKDIEKFGVVKNVCLMPNKKYMCEKCGANWLMLHNICKPIRCPACIDGNEDKDIRLIEI